MSHSIKDRYLKQICFNWDKQGEKRGSLVYRLRNLFLDRWNLWPRLTFYRTWKDREGKPLLNGSNNADERAIGWWVKERYRSMRGYKRTQSVLPFTNFGTITKPSIVK